jgi:hypothetical protein
VLKKLTESKMLLSLQLFNTSDPTQAKAPMHGRTESWAWMDEAQHPATQMHVFANTSSDDESEGYEPPGEPRAFPLGGTQDRASPDSSLGEEGYHLVLEYKIGGPLTYVTASTHCKRFVGLAVDHVLINLSRAIRIDIDGITALEVERPPAASGCWARGACRSF